MLGGLSPASARLERNMATSGGSAGIEVAARAAHHLSNFSQSAS